MNCERRGPAARSTAIGGLVTVTKSMAHTRNGSKRRGRGRIWLWILVCFMSILPRSAGAVVIHAHTGHGLHTHLVSGLQDARTSLDRASFHARHHAHEHPAEHGEPGHHHEGPIEGDLFLGLPSEPVLRSATASIPIDSGREAVAPFLAAFLVDFHDMPSTSSVRPKPPRPRVSTSRSGTRVLLATSRALLL